MIGKVQVTESTEPADLFAGMTLDTADVPVAGEGGGGRRDRGEPLPATERPQPDPFIVDPAGEVVHCDDPDALAECLIRLKAWKDDIYACERAVKLAVLALTEGDAKTRRVRGPVHRIKVEMPGKSWEQSILKEAWNAYPQFRDKVLGIGSINVKRREFNKMRNESGPPDFEQFRSMIAAAEREPTALPTVTVEE